ncbi:nucleotidyltransferase family protein [Candidimonas humi]|uniref:Nucleotidyltransferase family protein n=2 Tax=Candidimonas humi TaxID=683355 RepID=A0ABV8NYD2_9BURK
MIPDMQDAYRRQLCALVRSSVPLMNALVAVRSLGLGSWCIGAGAVRALVWDSLHGFQKSSEVGDLDVAYFDAHAPLELDAHLQQQLNRLLPGLNCEVTNQARVHDWYANTFGLQVAPLSSLEDGLATWPEYATCVGVFLDEDEFLHVVAPHGLDDLFELRVRHNPSRVTFDTFMQRVQSKRFKEKWPKLTICIS